MLEEIKKIILSLQWEEIYKKKLIDLLPIVEENYLKSIYLELKRNGSDFIGESLTDAVSKSVEAMQKLQNGQEAEVIEILNTAPDYAWWENGNFVFGWYLDLGQFIKKGKINITPELHEALGVFGFKMLQYLKIEQVSELIQSFLLVGLIHFHVLMEFKTYVYRNNLITNKKAFDLFKNAISLNNENMGKQFLLIEGKQLPPSVKNWIKDFYSWSPKGIGALNIFQLVQYSKTSANFTKLTGVEKEYILEVLKIYIWFLSPNVSETEVEEFIQFKKDEELRKFNDDFSKFVNDQKKLGGYVTTMPLVVPTPKKVVKEDVKVTSDPSTTTNKLADYGAGELQVKSNTEVSPSPLLRQGSGGQADLTSSSATPTTVDLVQGRGVTPLPPVKPVNIEEIMKKRKNTPVSNLGPGLYMGGDLVTSGKLQVKSNTEASPSSNLSPQGRGAGTQAPDIDKKLQELEQKIKKQV